MEYCECPDDGILKEISKEDCKFNLKQIQRMIFVNRGKVLWDSADGGGGGDGVPTVGGQTDTLADWMVLRSANDATKAVITPFIGGEPIIEAGDMISEGGGDNSTLNGIEEVTGRSPSTFTTFFRGLTPKQEREMKDIMCKTVEVYFINEEGRIAAKKPDESKENITGFNANAVFLSDRNNEGFATDDKHNLSLSLEPNWSSKLVLITPDDFNALYDLDL